VDNKSLFIRAVQLSRGGQVTTTTLTKVGAAWQTTGEAAAGVLLFVGGACARRTSMHSSSCRAAVHDIGKRAGGVEHMWHLPPC